MDRCEIENILEDVRLTLSENMISENAQLSVEINISEIRFSRRKLRTIMYNLLSNAIKYRTPGKQHKIRVKTYKENNYTVISVLDNGIGIANENLDTIFLKYGRVAEAIEGTGIGLYLVKEIVTNAAGRVEVESILGEGSEFKVFLKAD